MLHAGGPKTKVTTFVLARLAKGGRSFTDNVERYLNSRGLEKCHAATEILMLAMLLQKLTRQMKTGSVANLDAAEAMCKRVYGLWRVFGDVKVSADWKKPANAPRTWKTKVKWHLLKEYDPSHTTEDPFVFEDFENEVGSRLQAKANLSRNLHLADSLGAELGAESPEGG